PSHAQYTGGSVMPVNVSIPTILRTHTGGQKSVQANGNTLAEVINDLDSQHTGIKDRLVREGNLHRFVNVYVNDEDVRFAGGLADAGLHEPGAHLGQHRYLAGHGRETQGLRPGLRDAGEHLRGTQATAAGLRRADRVLPGGRRLEPGGRRRQGTGPAEPGLG